MGDMGEGRNYVFLDYDRTLFSHSYIAKASGDVGYETDAYIELSRLWREREHAGDKPLRCMQWYVESQRADGARLFVLTHEIFNLRDECKKRMAIRHYGIYEYLAVDTPDHKIDMIRAVCKANDVEVSNAVLVDDMLSTVYAAERAGISGLHLSDVVVAFDGWQAEHGLYVPGCVEGKGQGV